MIPLVAINMLAAVYRGGGKQQAYLEFAQDHFLDWLRAEHLFEVVLHEWHARPWRAVESWPRRSGSSRPFTAAYSTLDDAPPGARRCGRMSRVAQCDP